MRPPKRISGDYIITYKQIPYDDRYYFVCFEGVQIAQIPTQWSHFLLRLLPESVVWDTKWDKFEEKVRLYDKFLDENKL